MSPPAGFRLVLASAVAAAAWLLAALWDPVAHRHLTDIPVYRGVAARVMDGSVPYADFDVEYPPGAVGVFVLARLVPGDYGTAFSFLMFLALLASVAAVMWTARLLGLGPRRELAAGLTVALTPLLLGDLVATRFDLVVVAALAWCVAAAAARRFTWAWVLLGLAVALKLFPLVLAPLLWLWQRRAQGSPVRSAAAGAGVAAAVFLPFLFTSPAGIWALFDYHLSRPLQIESMGGGYLLGLHALAGIPLRVESTYGSQNLAGDGPDVVTAITTALWIAALVALAVTFATLLRRTTPAGGTRLFVTTVAATLAATVALGKVASPQFMLWLLPAGLLVAGRYGRHAFAATVGAMIVTQLYFPYRYWELVEQQDRPIGLLVIRNLLLLVLLAACWPRPDPDEVSPQAG